MWWRPGDSGVCGAFSSLIAEIILNAGRMWTGKSVRFPFFSFSLLFSVLGVLWRFVVWLLKIERERRESNIEGPTPPRETEGDVRPIVLKISRLFELPFYKVTFKKDNFNSSHLIKALVDSIKRRCNSAYSVVAKNATCCCNLLIRTSTGTNLRLICHHIPFCGVITANVWSESLTNLYYVSCNTIWCLGELESL